MSALLTGIHYILQYNHIENNKKKSLQKIKHFTPNFWLYLFMDTVAQAVNHTASNTKAMGLIPSDLKDW